MRIPSITVFLCLALGLSHTGCSNAEAPPQGWKIVSFKQTFRFQAPEALRDSNAQAIDSLAGTSRMQGKEVNYDFGWYSSDLREFADQIVQRSEEQLDGRTARFIETPTLLAVHVPQVRDRMRFTLIIYAKTDPEQQKAHRILRSVRFLSE